MTIFSENHRLKYWIIKKAPKAFWRNFIIQEFSCFQRWLWEQRKVSILTKCCQMLKNIKGLNLWTNNEIKPWIMFIFVWWELKNEADAIMMQRNLNRFNNFNKMTQNFFSIFINLIDKIKDGNHFNDFAT